ncbi:MAG: MBL fold metallo-hydrolase [Solirubrobacteraceae bacterium]
MTALGELPEDHLSIVVFGPGYGESIAVRSPDGRWLVVDSLRDPGTERNPALELLRSHDAHPDLLVLTHPHDDHAAGFAELVDSQSGGSGRTGTVPAATTGAVDPLRDPDAGAALRRGRTNLALSAIQARWDADPDARWPMRAGQETSLGVVRVHVLTPRTDLVQQVDVDPNRLSASLLLEWDELAVLLGADVPTGEWDRVDRGVNLGCHRLFKVSHHGSRGAQHERLSDPAGLARTWVLTPWTKAGRHLPRLEDGGDLDRLLRCVERVELTSPPVSLRDPAATPSTRTELSARANRATFGGDDLLLEYDDQPRSSEQGWVAAVLTADGDLVELRHGSAALTVWR